ncbi:unnamed protein product [Rhizopus stolonifer]
MVLNQSNQQDYLGFATLIKSGRSDSSLDPEQLDQQMEALALKVTHKISEGKEESLERKKALFYYFHRIKLLKASPAGKKASVSQRTAQAWGRKFREDPAWNIFDPEERYIRKWTFSKEEKE